jgi:diguanylate cyclase (GGDEF)-like protein
MSDPQAGGHRWRVLIIDDSRTERARLGLLLEDEGVDLIEAADGEGGAALARTARVDLVLLDYRMPGCDGFDTIRMLKSDPRTASVPVIMISAASDVLLRAQGLDLGAVDFLVKPVDPVELRARVRAALRTKRMHDQLERRASIDGLTGLANRSAFDEWLRAAWATCKRRGSDLAAILVDLDHFKQINDRYGHGIGDEVLRRFATTLREDIRLNDFIARYGGEEFVVMALDCDLDAACVVAERIRASVAALVLEFDGRPLRFTASVGVAATGDLLPASPIELIANADRALYAAKVAGRNAVWLWDGTQTLAMRCEGPCVAASQVPADAPSTLDF